MTDVPPVVQALAEAMHEVQCLPGSNPYHRYSDGHREPEERRASLILAEFIAELAARGLAIGPLPEQGNPALLTVSKEIP